MNHSSIFDKVRGHLLTFALVGEVAEIVVITIAYSGRLNLVPLGTGSATLADMLLARWRGVRSRGGQVIDLCEGAARFAYRGRGLKYGLVVLRTRGRELRIEVHEPRGALGQVLDAITSIVWEVGKAGIEALAAAGSDALREKASLDIAFSGGVEPG